MVRSETKNGFLPWLIVLGLWAVLHGALAATVASSIFHGQLPGPDEYMHLVRAAALRDGGGWYDNVIARSNAPYGDSLHWTRPLDMLLLTGATIFSLFLGAKQALFVAGVVVSPLLDLLACFAIAWAAFPLIGRDRSIFTAFLALIQPAVLAYTAAGRADHHSLLILLFALVIGGAIRTIAGRPPVRASVMAGVACGFAIWTSVEMTLLVALCQGAAAVSWIRFRQVSARPQVIVALAFLATMLLALVAEHPPHALLAVEFDRISIPYVVIAALVLAVWSVALRLERAALATLPSGRRFFAMAVAGTGAVVILLALFPGLIAGPLAGADPRLDKLWLARILENRPLAPTNVDGAGDFLFFVATVAIVIPYAVIVGWRKRTVSEGMPWIFLTAICALYFAMALRGLRLAPFAEIASAPLLADMIARLVDWSERRFDPIRRLLVNSAAVFLLMFGGVLSGAYLLSLSAKASDGKPGATCKLSQIAPLLNDPTGLGARPLIIATLLDRGPEILYRTPHSVVSSPYHRNGAGIWDTYRLFAATDEAESRAIIARRGIDLLIICPNIGEQRFFDYAPTSNNLYSRLLAGRTPDWLTAVPVSPATAGTFKLYRVRS